jgi:hypothetical protein
MQLQTRRNQTPRTVFPFCVIRIVAKNKAANVAGASNIDRPSFESTAAQNAGL